MHASPSSGTTTCVFPLSFGVLITAWTRRFSLKYRRTISCHSYSFGAPHISRCASGEFQSSNP